MQNIEQLAFVFVDALDLHVEQRARVHPHIHAVEDQFRQTFLVGALGGGEALLKSGVVGETLEFGEMGGIVEHPRPDRLRDEVRERRVGFEQPAAERDAIGLVDDAVRIELVEIVEDGLLDEFAVQRRDAIHLVGAEKGQISHAHLAAVVLVDQRDIGQRPASSGRLFRAMRRDAAR